MYKRIALVSLVLFLTISLTGCMFINTNTENSKVFSEDIEYEKLESLEVQVEMGVGELHIVGGAKGILQGEFIYSEDSWKPEVEYHSKDDQGYLSIRQPMDIPEIMFKNKTYKWMALLNQEPPINLNIELGIGKSELLLGTLNLRRVDIAMGIGETKVDLRGDWKEDVDVHIEGGIGNAQVLLPKNTGVRVKVEGGLGTVHIEGLEKKDNVYTNEYYESSGPNLNIHIEGGLGNIEVSQ